MRIWFWHHDEPPAWHPPPCMCDEIEGRVRAAIAMRDEMARWKTPLEEWIALQEMPVLRLKSEPVKPSDVLVTYWREKLLRGDMTTLSTQMSSIVYRSEPTIYDGRPCSLGLIPRDGDVNVGDILLRGNGRYQVTDLSDGIYGRVRAVKLRDDVPRT